MPVILLADNYNVTRDDIEQIARLSTIDSERWNQEQAQTIVLGALLVVIALLMLAVTAFECYKMNFFGLSSRLESAKALQKTTKVFDLIRRQQQNTTRRRIVKSWNK
ncbi:hypothetical protein KIN20_014635 [Parelaphostrongylus tenuis]|uniref:Uncharacterized protein n=1 Tax=Parelaphostrongylus tenuis TaxID=148309 RepID=A0AAD5MF71_PARTN|nr:hypothetical protein KIN20_014635 [Parelaphostrongylus tenuis]